MGSLNLPSANRRPFLTQTGELAATACSRNANGITIGVVGESPQYLQLTCLEWPHLTCWRLGGLRSWSELLSLAPKFDRACAGSASPDGSREPWRSRWSAVPAIADGVCRSPRRGPTRPDHPAASHQKRPDRRVAHLTESSAPLARYRRQSSCS